jgi:hypothetical protein
MYIPVWVYVYGCVCVCVCVCVCICVPVCMQMSCSKIVAPIEKDEKDEKDECTVPPTMLATRALFGGILKACERPKKTNANICQCNLANVTLFSFFSSFPHPFLTPHPRLSDPA